MHMYIKEYEDMFGGLDYDGSNTDVCVCPN